MTVGVQFEYTYAYIYIYIYNLVVLIAVIDENICMTVCMYANIHLYARLELEDVCRM